MKRTLCLILPLILVLLTLTACFEMPILPTDGAANEPPAAKTEEAPGAKEQAPAKESQPPEKAAEEVKTAEKPTEENKTAEEVKTAEENKTAEQKPAEESAGQQPPATSAPPVTESATSGKAEAIVKLARDLIGTFFSNGGAGPDTFDNSGFVYYIYRKNGIEAPRTAPEMASFGSTVTREEMKPGDIAVFSNVIGGPAAFVGIYTGDGKFIACNNPETPTKEQNMDGAYWQARFLSGRRAA